MLLGCVAGGGVGYGGRDGAGVHGSVLDPTCEREREREREREGCKCLCDVNRLIWGVIDGLILLPATSLPPPTQ